MVERRRQYNRQFKEQAVRLLQRGDWPLAQVARQLGVSESMLRRWRHQVQSGRSFSESGRLQRENRQLKRDMAMLKKTLVWLERAQS
jgi:transposase